MSKKLISGIIAFIMLSCNLCFASEPVVTRDYITRKSGKEVRQEEKLSVDYSDLIIEQGDLIRISFLDKNEHKLNECTIELTDDFYENEMLFTPEELRGAAYIQIEFEVAGHNIPGKKLPFEI